jgi:hypothetical protein
MKMEFIAGTAAIRKAGVFTRIFAIYYRKVLE